MPASRYAGAQLTPRASIPIIPASTSAATRIGTISTDPLYASAITISDARSSTTKMVSRKTRARSGTRRPSRPSPPSASAVSVDIATPQPRGDPSEALTAR